MKHYVLGLMAFALFCLLSLNGFQCGSAESTSAKLYISHNDLESAEKSLLKEVTNNPNNAESWWLLGDTRLKRGNYKGMLEAFDKSLAITKDFAANINTDKQYAWVSVIKTGVSQSQQSQKASKDSVGMLLEQAIENYKTAVMIQPDSEIGYHNLAIALSQSEKYDEAVTALQEAIKRKPSSELQSLLADAYLQQAQKAEQSKDSVMAKKDYTSALNALIEARKIDPANDRYLNSMVDLYTKVGRSEEAKPLIREGLAKDETNKIYQFNLGVLLMQTDSLEEAIPHFDAAIKSDSSFESAWIDLASTHMKLGKKLKDEQNAESKKDNSKAIVDHFKKAAVCYEKLTQLKKDYPDYWEYLGSAYANAGMIDKAKKAIEKSDALRKK